MLSCFDESHLVVSEDSDGSSEDEFDFSSSKVSV